MTDRAQQLTNLAQQAFDAVKTRLRGSIQQQNQEEYRAGFSDAAGISLQIVQKKMDALDARMTSGSLTKSDQITRAQLKELKTELEGGFDYHWERSDSDWRPVRRAATHRQQPSAEQ